MIDIKTTEGLRARIHEPDIAGPWSVLIFATGIGQRGTNIEKVDDIGPLFYVAHPEYEVEVNYLAVAPLNESGSWDEWEVRSILNYVLETYKGRINPGAIHLCGHSLGGGFIHFAASDPEISKLIASCTVVSPIKCKYPYQSIAVNAVPGKAYHAVDDSITYAIDTSEFVFYVNLYAGSKLWQYIEWPGDSHTSVGKVFRDPTWYSWLKSCEKQIPPIETREKVVSTTIVNGTTIEYLLESGNLVKAKLSP